MTDREQGSGNRDRGSGMRGRFGLPKHALAGALLASLIPMALPAQQAKPWEQIPIPALHDFKPHQAKRIELKNGIVLFLQEDHELPFISGSVLIPGGARDEDPAKTGMIDLYGQTWRTSGSEKMSGDDMDDLLASKAATIETGGDVDSTALSWNSLKGDSDQVYALAMDLLFKPKFNPEKLELAKQQDAAGIVRRNDDEGEIAGREAVKLVYGQRQSLHAPGGIVDPWQRRTGRSEGLARSHYGRQADCERERRF